MLKWSREQIIREILRRESAGLPLTVGGEGGVNNALYQASSRIFGSWSNAVMAAGIAPHQVQRQGRWPPQRVVLIIRALSRRQRPLRPGELKSRYGNLMEAARRGFGSWSKAVIAAGVDPQKLRRVVPWSPERIIEAILKLALKNEPLNRRSVQPRSLASAGERIFGTWESALVAAGLDPQPYVRKRRGMCRVADNNCATEVDQQNLIHGEEIVTAKVLSMSSSNSTSTIPISQGKQRRSWSDEKIIEAIRTRLHEQRKMYDKAVRRDDLALYQAARRRFGKWSNALVAAGLNPQEF